jgi:AraC family transcriptional regulator of adaptative response/methylated-DNA-[protein]-cysteine methyltransferase
MQAILPPKNELERAYRHSDRSYDGIFFLAVRTTGIFCKPSCPARKPDPSNVEYYPTAKDAVFAGYRPCKRCHPLDPNGRPPEWVTKLLAAVDRNPHARYSDSVVRSMHIDPARVRRYFQKQYGMTFQAYCRGKRLGEALGHIRNGSDLDDVALGFGYESHSGFRDAFSKTFGMPPGKSHDSDCIIATWIESPLGALVAAATSEGVCLLEFTDRRMIDAQFATLRRRFERAIVPGSNHHLEQLKRELAEYFAGTRTTFSVKLVYPGTPFQQKVWNELLKIPYGTTTSYEAIAQRIGVPSACRAVGTANGLNRIAIVIPCHRVVNKDGKLGGYGGGLRRKEALLRLERNHD